MNYSDCMNPPCQQHSEWEKSGQLKVWNHTWIFSEGCFQLLIMLSCTLLASEPEHFSMCVEHRGHICTHIYRERERENQWGRISCQLSPLTAVPSFADRLAVNAGLQYTISCTGKLTDAFIRHHHPHLSQGASDTSTLCPRRYCGLLRQHEALCFISDGQATTTHSFTLLLVFCTASPETHCPLSCSLFRHTPQGKGEFYPTLRV